MPFDGRQPRLEIQVIDKALEVLGRNGEHWIQGEVSDGRGDRCLMGALRYARHPPRPTRSDAFSGGACARSPATSAKGRGVSRLHRLTESKFGPQRAPAAVRSCASCCSGIGSDRHHGATRFARIQRWLCVHAYPRGTSHNSGLW